MSKRAYSILMVVLFLGLISFSGQAWAYSGGFGTEAEPYEIATPADLKAIGDSPLDWNLHFIQTANIDMSYYDGSDPDHTYNSIGIDSDHTFTGTFNGNGFITSNLTINKPGDSYLGLFGYCGKYAVLSNIYLENLSITGVDYIGGICGYNYFGKFINCSTTGQITGSSYYTGGICGRSQYGQFNNCYSSVSVVGYNYIGGLCGDNKGSIINCYTTGDVTGNENIGGFCGRSYQSTINNCYSTGNVDGVDKVGGFCGSNEYSSSSIENCYSVGSVTATATIDVGNFLGFNEGTTTACFYNNETALLARGVGYNNGGTVDVTGETTVNMMAEATFTTAGWDFSAIWDIDEGTSYPYFLEIPELEVTLDTNDADYISGASESIDLTAVNTGTLATSSSFTVRLYYHTLYDPDWDTVGSEWLLAEVTVDPPVAVGEVIELTLPFTVPANGQYYFKAIVDQDDAVDERDELNNWSGTKTVYCSTPDAYEPDNTSAEAVTITDTIPNRSLSRNDEDWFVFSVTEKSSVQVQAIGYYYWKLYLYDSDATTQLDYRGGWYSDPTINAVLDPGDYYIKIEPYNSSTYNIYDYTMNLSQSPVLPDLAVSSPDSPIYFSMVEPSHTLDAQCHNQGDVDVDETGGIDLAVYYSQDNSVNWDTLGSEAIVGTYNYADVLAATSSSDLFSIPITIPVGATYGYLRVKIDPDDVILESDEGDNWSSSIYFEMYTSDSYEPDDSWDEATVLPTDGTVQTHSIDPEIDQDWYTFDLIEELAVNINMEDCDGCMRVYLYDSGLNQINYYNFCTNYQIQTNLAAGTYYLMAEDEYNNNMISGYTISLTTEPVLPDLTVRNTSSSHISTTAGQMVAIPVNFKNEGNDACGAFDGRMYISTDPQCDWEALGSEAIVATANLGGISAGSSTNYSFSVTVPSTAGVYFYRVKVDINDAIVEISEDNNWSPIIIVAVDSKYIYGGGSGTSSDPYLIRTALQMNAIGAISADWDCDFKLTNDIDLGEYTGDQYNIIGNDSIRFTGTFDGDGHTILNFCWDAPQDYVGLWGQMDGTIKNLSMDNVNIDAGNNNYIGAIAGYMRNKIINCHVCGTIEGNFAIGGIAGCSNYGEITSCSSNGSIKGSTTIGGIVGWMDWNSDVEYCSSQAVVYAYASAGGIVGFASGNCTINTCFASGDVIGEDDSIGGLIGTCNNSNAVLWCNATGNVCGLLYVGGLIGNVSSGNIIQNCYSTGTVVSTGQYVGGLVGYNRGTILNCYTLSQVNGVDSVGGLIGINEETGQVSNCLNAGTIVATGSNIGGVVGYNKGNIINSFWDTDVSGYTTAVGFFYSGAVDADGLTTTELMNEAIYTAADWDLADTWRIDDGTSYPYLYTAADLTAAYDCPAQLYVACGGSVEIPFAVTNSANGEVSSGETFVVRLYRSTDGNWAMADLVGEVTFGELAPGGQVNGSILYHSDSVIDTTYYLRLFVDDDEEIDEKNETNNTADLTIMEYLPDSWEPDDTMEQASILLTDGTAQTHDIMPPTDIDWYQFDLAEDSTVDIQFGKENNNWYNGQLVLYDNLGSEIYTNTDVDYYGHINLDLVVGSYHLTFEDRDNNNIIEGYTVQLTAAPFRAELYGSGWFTINGEEGLRVSSGESDTYDFSLRIYNTGELEAANFVNTIYLCESPQFDGSEQLIDQFTIGSLAEGSYVDTTATVPVPGSAGVYYLICDIDVNNDVAEHDELNNQSTGALLAVDYNYSGGDGTSGDPYQIATPEDLYNLSRLTIDWAQSFALTADIDMAYYDGQTGPAFYPIGRYAEEGSFVGTFDGQEHVISNLAVSQNPESGYIAMFGHMMTGAIRNLGLENVHITPVQDYELAGALVGWCGQQQGVVVENCYSTGEIIVGEMQDNFVGGLIARVNTDSIIRNCYSNVHISVAQMNDMCSNSVGVLLGWCNGNVEQCYSAGRIDMANYSAGKVGGFVGRTRRHANIADCFSQSELFISIDPEAELQESRRVIGGFIGMNGECDSYDGQATINNCYSASIISTNRTNFVSGFCGDNKGIIQSCFWDSDIAGVETDYCNVTGLATVNMKSKDIYINAGWLFASNGGPWLMANGLSYPILSELYYFDGGSGTFEDPYQIRTPISLVAAGEKPDKHYSLKADIDLANYVVTKPLIGEYPDRPFMGVFDGEGHSIRNVIMYTSMPDRCGLFGYVTGPGATIRNLGIENVAIEAPTSSFVGGIVGLLEYGSIENCYVNASVNAWDSVGLLVGYSYNSSISNCYALGNVEGFWFTGGLCGVMENGSISNSYAACSSWSSYGPGAVVGFNKQGTTEDSFYNIDLAPDAIAQSGVIALTNEQFKNMDWFIDAGWDFIQEETNGTNDLWHMPFQTIGPPMLYWQKDIPGDFTGPYGVDIADFAVFSSAWLCTPGDEHYIPACNLDNTGSSTDIIDQADLLIFIQYWMRDSHPGDITGDNLVNLEDFGIVSNVWLQDAPFANLAAPDNVIDIADLVIITEHWLDGTF